ncbi:MAG: SDR family NAD(P)-dependent oxidoreductase [Candidatus Dojkabacteria bacterium]
MGNKRVALITGSSKGIGAAMAKELGRNGWFVYVTYNSDKKSGEEVLRDIGKSSASLTKLDVRNQKEIDELVDTIEQEHGKLDLLVNNAAKEIPTPLEDVKFDEFKEVFESKAYGAFLMTQKSLSLLKNGENAMIVNVSSSLGDKPNPKFPAYCLATRFLDGLTMMQTAAYGKYGIRVNAISPTTTYTSMWDKMGGDDPKMWESFAKNNPLGRVSTTDDVAKTLVWLISEETGYLNGNTIYVNGGKHYKP